MYGITPSETKIMKELVKELTEFNTYVRSGPAPLSHDPVPGNYFYAFNPASEEDKELYRKNIRLLRTINEVLEENCVNIKSQGYSYIRDAVCIITDRRSLDVCLVKEIYPLIAEKHRGKTISKVEHSIRNSIGSAYERCRSMYPERDCLMNSFDGKPTSKKFILRTVQEVSSRLLKELSL